jgi:magnesium chelatase family protein
VIDRIDMWIEVAHIPHSALKIERNEKEKPLLSPSIRERVLRARNIQKERFKKEGKTNRDMTVKEVQKYIFLKESAENILQNAAHHYSLSPRSYHRSLKLARTIADLAEKEYIEDEHILEALTYRPKGLFE